jgi:phosphatidate cytidylyltransferase
MSGASDIAEAHPRGKQAVHNHLRGPIQWNIDWITRPLFGFALAGLAVAATIRGGLVFVIFLSLGCGAAVREWHRLFAARRYLLPTIISTLAIVGALLWRLEAPSSTPISPYAAFGVLVIGGACNLLLGAVRRQMPLAHATGPLYVGLPALALLMIRQTPLHAIWLVVLIFLAIWATDTGALFSGKLIGGPKLAPQLSPKKTWAGSIGGLLCAALVCGALAAVLHARLWPGVVLGIVLSFAGQLGDLFESLVKRRVGQKDSGRLIPGHGGVLDRIDSLLFAAPIAALAILTFGFDPLVGAHW